VLQRVNQVLKKHDVGWDAAAAILSDFSQGVFKIKGVLDAMSSNNGEKFLERMRLTDMTRSVLRSVVVDTDEEFERTSTPTSGLADILDRFMMRLAAAAEMPVTKLYGQAPAGLNATGEADMRNWYDSVANKRSKEMKPAHERILSVLAKKPIEVEYAPLWEMSDKEKSEVQVNVSNANATAVNAGILTPEEAALSMADEQGCVRVGWSEVDRAGRETARAAAPYDVQAAMAQESKQAALDAQKNPPEEARAKNETP
jgi:phage-related protein (TIGR01555 family)